MVKLKPIELDLLQYVSEGGTYRSYARSREISLTAVTSRAARLFPKLGAESMTNAVALAVLQNLIPGPLVCDGHE